MYNAVADRMLHRSIPDPGGRWETTAAAYILSARAIDNNDDPLAFSALFARYILPGEGKD